VEDFHQRGIPRAAFHPFIEQYKTWKHNWEPKAPLYETAKKAELLNKPLVAQTIAKRSITY